MTKYILILALAGACNGAIMSSYGGRYRDSARARTVRIENYRREHDTSNKDFRFCKLSVRKYHPDSLCCAVGWRCLKGCILWIQHGMMRVRVKASDVMAPGYNDTLELHVDVSWRVYKALGVKHLCKVIVTVDSQSLIKHKAMKSGKVTMRPVVSFVEACQVGAPVDSILHALEDEQISRSKALEVIRQIETFTHLFGRRGYESFDIYEPLASELQKWWDDRFQHENTGTVFISSKATLVG